jgi:outer membrane protein
MQARTIHAAVILLGTMAAICSVAAAEEAAPEPVEESRWRLGAALGFGMRSNPLVQSDDIPIIVDFDIAWFGEHFFFDNGDIGLTLVNNDSLTASLIGRFNSDRVFFGNTDTRFVSTDLAGMPLAEDTEFTVPDRDYAVELGLELLMDGNWGQLQMTAFHDVSNTHDGFEVYVDYGYGWRNQRWYVEPSLGVSYKSDALNNYYWGVRDDEVSIVLPPYQADAGINAHARLMLGYQISKSWTLSLVAEYERLNDNAASSPLVDEQNVLGYFAGFGFRFR